MVQTTDGAVNNPHGDAAQAAKDPQTAFTGRSFDREGAPGGAEGFLSLMSEFTDVGIDKSVQPLLDTAMDKVKGRFDNARLERIEAISNGYAVLFENENIINVYLVLFVSSADASPELRPESRRLDAMGHAIIRKHASGASGDNVRICGSRVLLTSSEVEMSNGEKLGKVIIAAFMALGTSYRDVNISALDGSEFVTSWSVNEARAVIASISPHGTPPRVEYGMTLKVKIPSSTPNERGADEYRTVGAVGGYMDFMEVEETMIGQGQMVRKSRPIFKVTAIESYMPTEGMAMLMLGAFVPNVVETYNWLQQWDSLSKNNPQPGMLFEDPTNPGQPLLASSRDELEELMRLRFLQPLVAIQQQDGNSIIPGLHRMWSTDVAARRHFIARLCNFLQIEDEYGDLGQVTENIAYTVEGVYGDERGSGQLVDTRNIDYLYVANKAGSPTAVDPQMRRILLNQVHDPREYPIERARVVRDVAGSFIPLYLTSTNVVFPGFWSWLIERINSKGFLLRDPDNMGYSRRFGTSTSRFSYDRPLGTIATNSPSFRGTQMSSFWQNR